MFSQIQIDPELNWLLTTFANIGYRSKEQGFLDRTTCSPQLYNTERLFVLHCKDTFAILTKNETPTSRICHIMLLMKSTILLSVVQSIATAKVSSILAPQQLSDKAVALQVVAQLSAQRRCHLILLAEPAQQIGSNLGLKVFDHLEKSILIFVGQ